MLLGKFFTKEDGWESVEGCSCSVPKEAAEDSYFAYTWARKNNEDGSYFVFVQYDEEILRKLFSAVRWRFENSHKYANSLATGMQSESRANGLEDAARAVFRRADLPTCKLKDFLQE